MATTYVQREWRQEASKLSEPLDHSRMSPFPPQPERQAVPASDVKIRHATFTGSEQILTRLKSSNYLQPFSEAAESISASVSSIAAVRFFDAGATTGAQTHSGTTVQEREHYRNTNKNAVVAPHRRHYDEIVPMTSAGHKMNAILSYVANTLDADLPAKSSPHDHSRHAASSSGGSTRKSVSSVASSDASSQLPTSTISEFLSMAGSDSSMSSEHQTWSRRQRNAEQHQHFAVSTTQSLISQQHQFTAHPPPFEGHPPSSTHPSPPTPPRLPQSRSMSFTRRSLTSRFQSIAEPHHPPDCPFTALLEEEDSVLRGSLCGSQIPAMGDRSSSSRISDSGRKWLGATSVPQPPSKAASFSRAPQHSSSSSIPSRISLPSGGTMKGNEDLDIQTATVLHGDTRSYTPDGYSLNGPSGGVAGSLAADSLLTSERVSHDEGASRRSSRASISGGGSVCSTAARSLAGGRPLSRSSTTSFASRKEEAVDSLLTEHELGKSIERLHHTGRNDPLAVALQRTLARERARRHSSAAGAEIPASRLPGLNENSSSVAAALSTISRSWVASQALNTPTLFEVLERQARDVRTFPDLQGPFTAPGSANLAVQYSLLTQCANGIDGELHTDNLFTPVSPTSPNKHFFPVPDPTLIPPPPTPQRRMVQRSASLSRVGTAHRQQHPLSLSSNELDLQSLRESIMNGRSSHLTVTQSAPSLAIGSQRHRASDDGAFRQHVHAYHSILTDSPHMREEDEESEDTVAPLSLVDQRLSAMRLTLSEKTIKPGSGAASQRRHGSESGYGSGGKPLSTAALLAHGVTTSNGTSTSQWAARSSTTTHSIIDSGERASGGRLGRSATMTGGSKSPASVGFNAGSGGVLAAAASVGSGGAMSSARRSISRASSFNNSSHVHA